MSTQMLLRVTSLHPSRWETLKTQLTNYTFQLVGWFTFGTFLILKGALLNAVYEEKSAGSYASTGYGRSYGRSLTEELGVEQGDLEAVYTVPYVKEWTVGKKKKKQLLGHISGAGPFLPCGQLSTELLQGEAILPRQGHDWRGKLSFKQPSSNIL